MFEGYRILIFSEDPDKLMPFYRDVLGMEEGASLKLANDYGYGLIVNKEKDIRLWIGKHSEVKGKSTDQFRHIFNLYVDSVFSLYEKIKDVGSVTIVCKPEKIPQYTEEDQRWVCTFLDPENNCWQFMGRK